MPAKKRPESDSESEAPKNKWDTDFGSINFDCDATTKSGEKWNLKISSWFGFLPIFLVFFETNVGDNTLMNYQSYFSGPMNGGLRAGLKLS
jgi:hypothetical protein